MKFKVNVTKKDIKSGIKCDPSFCPISIAVKRVTKADEVLVCADVMNVRIGNMGYHVRHGLRGFVQAFDKGLKVLPGVFEIDIKSLGVGNA